MTTQKVVEGLGTVKVPQRKTMNGRGRDKMVADLIWCKNIMKKQTRSEWDITMYQIDSNNLTIGGCSADDIPPGCASNSDGDTFLKKEFKYKFL